MNACDCLPYLRFFCCGVVHRYIGRSSEKSQNWLLFPGDPRDALGEFTEFAHGAQVEAIRAVAARLGREPTATEVHEHMLARSRQWPIVHMVVLWLRLWELVWALVDTKHRGPHGERTVPTRCSFFDCAVRSDVCEPAVVGR